MSFPFTSIKKKTKRNKYFLRERSLWRSQKRKNNLRGTNKEGDQKVGTVKCSVKIMIIYLDLGKERKHGKKDMAV